MKEMPYGRQFIDREDIKAVVDVLKSGWITQGPKIKEFESTLCKYTGAKYSVVASSGTAALHLACLALGIKQNDEVITSPVTFVASGNCILYCGGKPVFADIKPDTVNIDPKEIIRKITKKTKAIIPVHFAGRPCDLHEIKTVAKKHDLLIIEDAAHALGAEYKGSKVGNCRYSDMTVFSFHPVKSITTGEGGAILTNNKKYYNKLVMLRQHGVTKDYSKFCLKNQGQWHYEMQTLGFNYRITDFQCALGISQLKKIDKFINKRRKIVKIYNEIFRNNDFFDLPIEEDNINSSWHLYPIRLKDKYKGKKSLIFNKLRERGLKVQVHYKPVYLQLYYQYLGYKKGICPNAEDFYQREISIPLYYSMTAGDARYVKKKLFNVIKGIDI